jgi:hypothetical protein
MIDYTVLVVVLTDLAVPPVPLKLEEEKALPPNPFLKKSSFYPKKDENPLPNPPNPPCLPFLRRLKKLLKKSSSSWSNSLVAKNFAKMSSAWLKSKWLKVADLGPLNPYVS